MVDSHLNRDIGRVLVGRQKEMGELKAALEDALSGQGRLVMLAGEPGIGKTRSAQELASYAEEQGAQVLWGWCYEEEGAPAYWPWVQSIRSYVRHTEPERIRSELGPGAAVVAELLPEIREMLSGLEVPPKLEAVHARFRLFDSITTFLKNAAQHQPLVIVLDDLHWADKPSLLLLQFLVRHLAADRLLVLGCYRDVDLSRQHSLSDTLAQLNREPAFQRHVLRRLSLEDSQHLIQAAMGTEPPAGLVESIYRHTEGNPFFLTEVIRLLAERGELAAKDAGGSQEIRIPEGVREVIGQRLNRLSGPCNQMLTVASIIGREFSLEQLSRLVDDPITSSGQHISEALLLEVVDEASASGVIEELPESAERYQFTHALIQETLADELSAARRVRLHARIAEAMEELYGDRAEDHAVELAFHFAGAEPVLGADKLAHYALLAGERALAVYAHEEALLHFERALGAKEGKPPSKDSGQGPGAENGALLFGLGRAQVATLPRHRIGEALDSLSYAFDHFAQAGDAASAVAVAEYPLPVVVGHLTGAAGLINRALALVPPDSHEAGRLFSRYVSVVGTEEGDYDAAQKAFGQAMAIARREEDTALELRTLVNAANVDNYHLRLEQCLEKNLMAIDLARHIDDPLAELDARFYASTSLSRMGEPEGGRLHASAMLGLADKMGHRHYISRAYGAAGQVAFYVGDWDVARDLTDRGLTVAPGDPAQLAPRVLIEAQVGDLEQTEAFLARYLEALSLSPSTITTSHARAALVIPFAARLLPLTDRSVVAEEWGEAIFVSPSASPVLINWAGAGLALLAVQRGDESAARRMYAALEHQRGSITTRFIADDRLLGLLSQTGGDLDRSAVHFDDALAFCRKAGYRPELAWTCCDYSDTLLQRGAPGDRHKAIALLDESLAIAEELGMQPLMERVASRRDRVQAGSTQPPTYPDGLSQREVEVLSLVAMGRSNPEIAEQLFISPNTVAHHMTNILNKTNSSNRTEAATYAVRKGLM